MWVSVGGGVSGDFLSFVAVSSRCALQGSNRHTSPVV